MSELNKANRQVCDVDIRILKTMAPFLFFDTANTTTAGLSSDNVYAMAKGARKITFQNPLEGTMTIEAQVFPFEVYALFSDGVVDTSAVYAVHDTIKASQAGKLTIQNAKAPVFVYKEGEYGKTPIEGTYTDGTFSATSADDIEVGSEYEVGYLVTKETGVKKVSINNKKLPKDYYITQKTLDKNEDGELVPFVMTAYKATIQRNLDLSFSSEGDPMSITLTFDLQEDANGNVVDMIELTDESI